jgi:hypothetical protein
MSWKKGLAASASKRDVADLVDDEQRVAAESLQLGMQPPGGVGVGETVDPLGGGGELDVLAGLGRSAGRSARGRFRRTVRVAGWVLLVGGPS